MAKEKKKEQKKKDPKVKLPRAWGAKKGERSSGGGGAGGKDRRLSPPGAQRRRAGRPLERAGGREVEGGGRIRRFAHEAAAVPRADRPERIARPVHRGARRAPQGGRPAPRGAAQGG